MAVGVKCLNCNKFMVRHEREPSFFICIDCHVHINAAFVTRNTAQMKRILYKHGRKTRWKILSLNAYAGWAR